MLCRATQTFWRPDCLPPRFRSARTKIGSPRPFGSRRLCGLPDFLGSQTLWSTRLVGPQALWSPRLFGPQTVCLPDCAQRGTKSRAEGLFVPADFVALQTSWSPSSCRPPLFSAPRHSAPSPSLSLRPFASRSLHTPQGPACRYVLISRPYQPY